MTEKIENYKPVIKKEDSDFIKNRLDGGKSKVDTEIDWIHCAQFLSYKNKRINLVSKAIFIGDWEVEKPKKYAIKFPMKNVNSINEYSQYLCRPWGAGNSYGICDSLLFAKKYTKAEIDADEGLKKLVSVCKLIEVED